MIGALNTKLNLEGVWPGKAGGSGCVQLYWDDFFSCKRVLAELSISSNTRIHIKRRIESIFQLDEKKFVKV